MTAKAEKPKPIWFTTRVRRGLGLVSTLLREETIFAAAIVEHWPAEKRHDLSHALAWIGQEAKRPPRKITKKRTKKVV